MKYLFKIIPILFLFSYGVSLFSQVDEGFIYKNRREKLLSKAESNSIIVLESAEIKSRNSDIDFKFKQDPTFQYLTGITEPNSFFILLKPAVTLEGKEIDEILFVREKNPMMERWTGEILSADEAKSLSRADTVLPVTKFRELIKNFLAERKFLYLSRSDYSQWKDMVTDQRIFLFDERKKKLKETFPNIETKSLHQDIAGLREIKDSIEIEKIRRAVDATVCGYIEAIKSCEAGMYEYDIQAIIEYAFRRMGAGDIGFPSIVGSGKNALTLHYDKNRCKLNSGDLLIMDIGAEYEGYSADLSRTIPINGKFSQPQKDIYNIVLKASNETIKIMTPGTKRQDIEKKALMVVAEGLKALNIIKDEKEARKFMPHGVCHDFGLDVHDLSTSGALKAGQTLTIEPGIYIPNDTKNVDPKYLGIGVRIEDDILVTASGNEVLTKKAPKNINEIEKIMQQKGLGNIEIGNYK